MRHLADQEWDKMQQSFSLNSGLETDVTDGMFCAPNLEIISPGEQTDAQTLAMMLQEQLDVINNEIRLIQEEKQTTEARAEELESRVGSLEHVNLLSRSRPLDKQLSPPCSGQSSPRSRNSPPRDYLQKYHTVGFKKILMIFFAFSKLIYFFKF